MSPITFNDRNHSHTLHWKTQAKIWKRYDQDNFLSNNLNKMEIEVKKSNHSFISTENLDCHQKYNIKLKNLNLNFSNTAITNNNESRISIICTQLKATYTNVVLFS